MTAVATAPTSAKKNANRTARPKAAQAAIVKPKKGLDLRAMSSTNRNFLTRHGLMKSTRTAYDSPFAFGKSRTYHEAASNSPSIEYAPDYGPNAANGEIETLRRRSRWTFVNDSFFKNACENLANNVIHYGIKPRIKDPVLRKLWRKWVREADASGATDYYGLQHSIMVALARDGEVFIRLRQRRPGDMKSGILVQLQVLEPDYVPLSETRILENGNIVISGVEKNQFGRVVAYWMYDYHPKDVVRLSSGNLPRRVPASEVIHVYKPDRSEGTRGKPWGTSALNKTEGLKTYDDAELERKKGNAMHGGFIRPPAGEDGKATLGVEGQDDRGIDFAGMEPGTWTITPPGYEVDFANPPGNDQNYPIYRREGMSEVSVAFGLSVEHVTLNFEKLNDRQWRANNLEVSRGIESIQNHVIIPTIGQAVYERFVTAAYLGGAWSPGTGTVDDSFDVDWIVPARGHIHPVQDVTAHKEAVAAGFISRKRVAASYGDDVEDIDEENALDQQRAKNLGLQYAVYGALSQLDFSQILAQALRPQDIAALSDNDASDPGSMVSSG